MYIILAIIAIYLLWLVMYCQTQRPRERFTIFPPTDKEMPDSNMA